MRIVWLIVVGLIAYAIGAAVFFPAAPVVDRIRPQLGAVALEGVSGRLYKGQISSVRSTDDLLPLELSNVGWTLAPLALLGGGGATIRFDAYGGEGEGLVTRGWNGNISVTDFKVNMQAKLLEPLLPVPIATFSGEILGDISTITLANNLLTRFDGILRWNDAVLETPVPTQLGNMEITITPVDEQTHDITVSANGGDVAMQGSISVNTNGDFSADVLFTPSSSASADVLNGLRQIGRPDAEGRVRFVRRGNVNRLI